MSETGFLHNIKLLSYDIISILIATICTGGCGEIISRSDRWE